MCISLLPLSSLVYLQCTKQRLHENLNCKKLLSLQAMFLILSSYRSSQLFHVKEGTSYELQNIKEVDRCMFVHKTGCAVSYRNETDTCGRDYIATGYCCYRKARIYVKWVNALVLCGLCGECLWSSEHVRKTR